MLNHNGIYHHKHQSSLSTRNAVLGLSLCLNVILIVALGYFIVMFSPTNNKEIVHGVERTWHGGHPKETHPGSCWCGGEDHYCMCTPNLAIDLIIVTGREHQEKIWLVRRKDTNQLATMGGFVDVDETMEDAVKRELKEEMDIDLGDQPTILFGLYSDPRRDHRRRTVSAAFVVHLDENHMHPHAGDDAKDIQRISLNDIEQHTFYADHKTILMDYRRFIRGEKMQHFSEGDFAIDIDRSTCASHSDLFFTKT